MLFDKETTGTSITAEITGYQSVDYLLRARAGQYIQVTLTPDSHLAYFNIFTPGDLPGQAEAMYIGSVCGQHFEGLLSEDGSYLIQVYQMRSAA